MGCIAISYHDICALQLSDVDPTVAAASTETLTQMHQDFFVQIARGGCQIIGISSGILLNRDVIYNRSFPIITTVPTFERLSHDPRSIARDLKQVFVEHDPFYMLCAWQQILASWGGVSKPQTEYRFMLAFDPPSSTIHNRENAESWMQHEDNEWTGKWRVDDRIENGYGFRTLDPTKPSYKCAIGALPEKWINEDLEKAVKPASGFWLFPMDAFGPVPSGAIKPDRRWAKEILDLAPFPP